MKQSAEKLISRAAAIEDHSIDALGFMARCMVMATMPHKAVPGVHFQRTNGDFTLTITATDPNVGLPYGSIPRLLLAWMTTEAVRTKSPKLELGDSLSSFMRELELVPTYGRWGTVARLRDQATRLFACNVRTDYKAPGQPHASVRFDIAPRTLLWWDTPDPEQRGLWGSQVTLSREFFEEVTARPVPVNMEVLKILKKSPLALDIYTWSTLRASYLSEESFIPWDRLQGQFGGNYGRLRAFKAAFIRELGAVASAYPGLRFTIGTDGLTLRPSRTSIPKKG